MVLGNFRRSTPKANRKNEPSGPHELSQGLTIGLQDSLRLQAVSVSECDCEWPCGSGGAGLNLKTRNKVQNSTLDGICIHLNFICNFAFVCIGHVLGITKLDCATETYEGCF